MRNLPDMHDLVAGRVYRLAARNFTIGVWNGDNGFIGIRTKFGERFLATEYHWDYDTHYGTVRTAEDLNLDVPDGIVLAETLGTQDRVTGRPLKFDRPVATGGRGWVFTDTDEEAGLEARAVSVHNDALFGFLDALAEK